MDRVIIDTSVWIDFLHGAPEIHVQKMSDCLSTSEVCTCSPIVQEVLQGIRSDADYQKAKKYILDLEMLNADSITVAIESADLYRFLRKKGVTIRKSNDCVIAWFAIMFGAKLLHNDKDFETIRRYTSLQIF